MMILYLLVSTLWLVNLAVPILLYGQLNFKVACLAKLFRDSSPSVLYIYSKYRFETFTLIVY